MKSVSNFLKLILLCLVLNLSVSKLVYSKDLKVSSPDNKIQVRVSINGNIRFSVFYNNILIINPSEIFLEIDGKSGKSPSVRSYSARKVNELIYPVIPTKYSSVPDHFNELQILFRNHYSLIFRAYNDGFAYRFQTSFNNEITVTGEMANYEFTEDYPIYFPKEESFFSHNEKKYIFNNLSKIKEDEFCSLPMLLAPSDGPKILISESDLIDYPGMWLKGTASQQLQAIFPKAPLQVKQKNDRDVPVIEREPFLAKTNGTRSFPWRVFIITENEGALIESDMVFRLARPNQLKDVSWIRPGKVAWDWWNNLNIYGVNFKAGINTDTYKYYIDFASEYGIEYIILDEGWYKLGNLLDINPDIDMNELFSYAKEKKVGIILWVIWKTLDDQMEVALDQFAEWGAAGIKVDFMQRDDQWMVNYYSKIAMEAAKRELLVDYHGAYKPTGLHRTYPNVITREGVMGLEWNKWSDEITPEHDLTIPFIRMVAGPMDYTPGAMVNTQKENFMPVFSRPMSQGTRVHQLAMYVVYESPLQMLADSPSNYLKEKECTEFIVEVPVTWDETKVLDGKVGEYILIARRKGEYWYVAAMTNSNERVLEVNFSFLKSGDHTIVSFFDGVNANRFASDYRKEEGKVTNKDKLRINLAKGGGWIARIR